MFCFTVMVKVNHERSAVVAVSVNSPSVVEEVLKSAVRAFSSPFNLMPPSAKNLVGALAQASQSAGGCTYLDQMYSAKMYEATNIISAPTTYPTK
jgi:hypothetical protein